MSRDLMDENYYISHGGKIPVKWTAPEVCRLNHMPQLDLAGYISVHAMIYGTIVYPYRHSTSKSSPLPVMCGVMAVSCTRYGALDTNHLRGAQTIRYALTSSPPPIKHPSINDDAICRL